MASGVPLREKFPKPGMNHPVRRRRKRANENEGWLLKMPGWRAKLIVYATQPMVQWKYYAGFVG
jgi:hypothetical protein